MIPDRMSGSFTCEFCDMRLPYKSRLINHVEDVHLKIKRFFCEYCEKGFPRAHHLSEHVRSVHLKEKRHSCTICDSSFFSKSTLKTHVESVHEKKKPYVCLECDKRFSTKYCLGIHVRSVHLDIRPFVCRFCGWTFKTNGNMNRHIDSRHIHPVTKGMSRGEKAISDVLELEGIRHVREKSFCDLKGPRGGYLRYDFAIEIGEREERYLLIEFDGAQHFRPVMLKGDRDEESALERYNLRVRHDRIKDRYVQTRDVGDIVRHFLKDYIL